MSGRIVYLSETPPDPGRTLFDDVPHVMERKTVAELMGVDVKTVSREIQRGRLKCFHVGRSVRITRDALIEYVKEGEGCM